MPSVQLRSFGGLNTDSHVQDIRNGDYTDAKNIEHVSAEKGESLAITPRTGNEFAFDLGSVTAQGKRYLFKFSLESPDGIFYIRIKNSNGVTDFIPTLVGLVYIPSRNDFESAIVSAWNGFRVIDATSDPIIAPSIDSTKELAYIVEPDPNSPVQANYELTVVENYFIVNEIIELEGGGISGSIDIECITECIPLSREGQLEVIGSKDILGDLFIISSNKREDPVEVNLFFTVVDIIANGVAVNITFNSEYQQYLYPGQEIYISGVEGLTSLNGLYTISSLVNPLTVQILNFIEVQNIDNGNPSQPYVQGTGKATLNPFGIGEIGVATKNESRNEWTYTRLLRSRELNFWIKHQFDMEGEVSFNRKSLYFTDDFNPPKLFYYRNSAPYVQDGAIKGIYPDYGIFNYDSISDQTNHILGQPSIDIDLVEQQQGGGGLYVGNHRYFVRGVLGDGSYTDWSLPSGAVPVYFERFNGDPRKIIGNISGTATYKQNVLRISNLNSSLYKFIEVACILYIDLAVDTTTYGVFNRFAVSEDVDFLIITHTGREEGVDLIPEELSIQTEVVSKAKNNAIVDNRYILSNLTIPNDDFSDILNAFTYSIKKKDISRVNTYPNFSVGGHQDPMNVFYYTGYMLNETYRIGCRFKYKSGYASPVYKIFDVTIDTEQTSSDNKRTAGLDNYDLVSLSTTSQGRQNYVPYIEISSPDLSSFLIDGIQASQVIDRIEYFRAEVKNPTIVGYGFAVNHVKAMTLGSKWPPLFISSTYNQVRSTGWYITSAQPTSAQDSSSPISNGPMVTYEFPFIVYSQASPGSGTATGGFPGGVSSEYLLPSSVQYYDPNYTMNSGPLSGKEGGYIWKDDIVSIYLIDSIITEGKIDVIPNDIIINIGQADGNIRYTSYLNPPYSYYIELFNQYNSTQKQEVPIENSVYINSNEISSFEGSWVAKYAGVDQNTNGQRAIYFIPNIEAAIDYSSLDTFDLTQNNIRIEFAVYNQSDNVQLLIASWENTANLDTLEWITAFNNSASSNGTGIIAQGTGTSGQVNILAPVNDPYWLSPATNTQLRAYGVPSGAALFEQFADFQGASVQTTTTNIFNSSYVAKLETPLSPFLSTALDKGFRIIQVKRLLSPGTFQYSPEGLDSYVYTGSFQKPGQSVVIDIFGGDTYTSQVYYRTFVNVKSLPNPLTGESAQAINFTGQTKSNSYLIYKDTDNPDHKVYPFSYTDGTNESGFNDWLSKQTLDTFFYNSGYDLRNLFYGFRAGPPIDTLEKLPTRIIYSDLKPQNARSDFYRRFGILSYTDLDASFGEIIDMKNINGELFTLQPNKYQRQFFNTRGTLQLSDTSQIVLGDASVLSRPGVTITSYGCSNKWSVFLGRSQGGDDVVYWYDRIRKKFMRFGADGAVPISDRAFVRTAALNDTKWVLDFDSPALNYGMHGVWNQRLGEAIWTIRAHRKPDLAWVGVERELQPEAGENPIIYKVNEIVYLEDETNFLNFEQTIVLYVVIQEHSSELNIKPGVTQGWEEYFFRPSIDDKDYYNINTISYSEFKNRFSQFQETYHPRIYLQWNDTFLSPRPKDPESNVYEHNSGDIMRWYAHNGEVQEEEGYIEVVFNIDPNITKRYVALICNSEFTPYRLELETRTQTTFINGPDFEQQLEQFFAPIPNVAVNGQTDLDKDFMYGQWVKIRFYYEPGEFQRFTNIVLKFNPMVRLWNT
jgi:hypothetical protein